MWLSVLDPSLAAFLDELAEHWKGWKGVKTWSTYEGGLALACVHDGRGTVEVTVDLFERSGGIGWHVVADVPVDAGQLGALAAEARSFFG